MADENTVKVRVAGRDFVTNDEVYQEGEELVVSESTADAHPVTLERVEEGGDSERSPPFDPDEFTVDDFADELAEAEPDLSDEDLEALAAAERDGRARTGILDAIEEHHDHDQDQE